MRRLACLASFVVFASASIACTEPAEENASASSTAEVSEDDGRRSLPEEVRIIVQKDASSPKMCLVYERPVGGMPGKLKASQCIVGGEVKVGSEKCTLGGDGCWRVGRMEAWRAVRTEGSPYLVELIHLEGAHLSAMPGENASVEVTPTQASLLGLVDGHLVTPMSGSIVSHMPGSEWCATLEERGGDTVLGLKKYWSADQSGPKDYSGCASITLEHAQQVFGPLPIGMRAGDACDAAALANLAIAKTAPEGARACTQAGLVCVDGTWKATSCADVATSSRSFCSSKGFCDYSMSFPAENAPCANPKDDDALSCGTVLTAAGTPNIELTCQDGFWKKQSCASFASSSHSYCGHEGRCDSVGH